MRTTSRLFTAALALAAATSARAESVEATASTVMGVGQQLKGAPPQQTPGLETVAPLFEIISVRARDLKNPVFQNLEVVVAGWGSYDFGAVRWNAGTTDNLTGDLTTGYVRGQLFNQALTLRLGRAYEAAGVGRMLQIDGGDLLVRLPGNVALSAFGGVPVSQRFSTRAGEQSWNPAGGELAYGGRLGWTLPFPGAAGRALDVGLSAVVVEDAPLTFTNVPDPTLANPLQTKTVSDGGGTPVRRDVGLDLRLQPIAGLVFTANGTYSMAAGRLAEASAAALWNANQKTFVTFDVRFTSPDLFLSQNSILSVFTDTQRTDVGGGVRYQLTPTTNLGADYHLLIEPTGEGSATDLGQEALVRAEWERGASRAGGEVSYLLAGGLASEQNGYVGARAFGRHDFGRYFVTGDVQAYWLKQAVNGIDYTVSGTVSAGYDLGRGWSAVVAGQAGVTPFLEQQANLMAKLVYNQTYRVREGM